MARGAELIPDVNGQGNKIVVPTAVLFKTYSELTTEMGLTEDQYSKQLETQGIVGVLPLFKKLVPE